MTWAFIEEDFQPGVVCDLRKVMRALVSSPDGPATDAHPVPVTVPG